MGATDADTQEYFSRLVGTEERQQESLTKDRKKIFSPDISSTTSTVEKAIIKPEEFAYLKVAIALTPSGYFRVEKYPYYRFRDK